MALCEVGRVQIPHNQHRKELNIIMIFLKKIAIFFIAQRYAARLFELHEFCSNEITGNKFQVESKRI